MQHTLKAVVLRETAVKESDKLLTLLSEERGKITAYAKGARSLGSRSLAASGQLSYSLFTLNERQGRFFVSQASPIETFYGLRLSIEKMALAFYMAELSEFCSHESMESGELLRLLLNGLYLLSQKEPELDLLKAAFELRLLSIQGHAPDLTGCERCGASEGALYLSLSGGTMVCEACRGERQDDLFPLSPAILAAMRYILYSEPKKVYLFSLQKENAGVLAGLTEQYLKVQFQHEFRTLSFYHSIT